MIQVCYALDVSTHHYSQVSLLFWILILVLSFTHTFAQVTTTKSESRLLKCKAMPRSWHTSLPVKSCNLYSSPKNLTSNGIVQVCLLHLVQFACNLSISSTNFKALRVVHNVLPLFGFVCSLCQVYQ